MARVKRVLVILSAILCLSLPAKAQYGYGTTGLLNMPTAEMQSDKTFMFGVSYLEKHASVSRWFYNTYNYYLNITLFPWFEFTYNMELHKAVPNDRGLTTFWLPYTYGKFANQDRQFGVRLRLWKASWWKSWTPQIVFGWDDVSSNSWGRVEDRFEIADNGANNFNFRMYLAATKTIPIDGVGIIGTHAAYLYNRRSDYPLNGVALGANFRFKLTDGDDSLFSGHSDNSWQTLLNGLNLMAELYPAAGNGYSWTTEGKYVGAMDRGLSIGKYDINIGATYTLWKDQINLIGELYGCKDFSGGIQFKVHLK